MVSLLPGRPFTGCANDSEVSRLQEMQGLGRGAVWAMITNIATAQHVDLITLAHPTGHSLCGVTTYIMLLNSYLLPSLLKLYFKPNLRKSACEDPFPFSKSACLMLGLFRPSPFPPALCWWHTRFILDCAHRSLVK